jgi:hypothetical protein
MNTAKFFGPICRAILWLIFEQLECTSDNAYNSVRDFVNWKIYQLYTTPVSEDGSTNWA